MRVQACADSGSRRRKRSLWNCAVIPGGNHQRSAWALVDSIGPACAFAHTQVIVFPSADGS